MSSNKKLRIIIFLMLLTQLSNYSFSQRLSYSRRIPIEQYRIDVDHAFGGNVQAIISHLEYIPLAGNTSNKLIQGIFKIEMLEDTLGILSSKEKQAILFLYRTNGQLIKMIDILQHVNIPKDQSIFEMKVWDNQFVLSTANYKIAIDARGENISVVKQVYEASDSVRINSAIWKYAPYDQEQPFPSPALRRNGHTIIQYEQGRIYNDDFTASYLSPVKKNTALSYLNIPPQQKVFVLDKDSVVKIYDFIFPLKNIIDTSVVYTDKEYINLKMKPNIISSMDNIIQHNDFLLFNSGISTYAFNVKTKSFLNFESIIPDSSNDFIILQSSQKIFTDGEYLYTIIYPIRVREAEQKCKEEHHMMRDAYQKLKNHKNPILVKFKLKQL